MLKKVSFERQTRLFETVAGYIQFGVLRVFPNRRRFCPRDLMTYGSDISTRKSVVLLHEPALVRAIQRRVQQRTSV